MTAETENLVLQILKQIQAEQASQRQSVNAVHEQISSLREDNASIRADLAAIRRDMAMDARMRSLLIAKVDTLADAVMRVEAAQHV